MPFHYYTRNNPKSEFYGHAYTPDGKIMYDTMSVLGSIATQSFDRGFNFRGREFVRLMEVDNPLKLPFGTDIKLSITSDDVIHS